MKYHYRPFIFGLVCFEQTTIVGKEKVSVTRTKNVAFCYCNVLAIWVSMCPEMNNLRVVIIIVCSID